MVQDSFPARKRYCGNGEPGRAGGPAIPGRADESSILDIVSFFGTFTMNRAAGDYIRDCTTIKAYGNIGLQVVNLNACLHEGVERKISPKGSINAEKLGNNLSRAKSRVKEMALCNPWDYWCTFTVSPQKYDRFDLAAYYRDFAEFIHNYNKRTDEAYKVRYLLIPEMHKDGAWHLHGFIRGIRPNDLYINEHKYLTWREYEKRFGFISMSVIQDLVRTANYSLKYMTKDTARNNTELGAHLYYASNGLKRAETIFKGYARAKCEWDFEGQYCRIKWYTMDDKGMREYISSVELIAEER